MSRKRLTKSKRFQVLRRDGFRCRYCGRSPEEDGVRLEVDHVVPVANGGTNHPANLKTSCYDCNRGKGTGPARIGLPRHDWDPLNTCWDDADWIDALAAAGEPMPPV